MTFYVNWRGDFQTFPTVSFFKYKRKNKNKEWEHYGKSLISIFREFFASIDKWRGRGSALG